MNSAVNKVGQRAETKVTASLEKLPSPWQYFPTVEWRSLNDRGEAVGEADVVIFHPQYGLAVFEIKAGAVDIREGVWHYGSGLAMKQSPFSQARRNRYALIEKLTHRLGKEANMLTVTHAVWFPDVIWKSPLPGTEAPSKAFLLDRTALANPEPCLLRLFREVAAEPVSWTRIQQQALKELLAPDCQLLVPLVVQVDDAVQALHQATEQQIAVMRMLRSQARLLVEGAAGSGKTLLACALAREHAALGKSVLLTCFNRQLAIHLANCLANTPNVRVVNFHELVKQLAEAAGIPYDVPMDAVERGYFFRESVAEILLNASEILDVGYDSIIVDEAADFAVTWWVALETLGRPDFSWYCFYDRRQSIYQDEEAWQPPFSAAPMQLDINLRNPQLIGEFAAKIGQSTLPVQYRVEGGTEPVITISASFDVMANQLRQLLRDLLRKENMPAEQVVVLAPYRHTKAA